MDQPVKLTPLLCLNCSLPIPAEPEEVAWVCAQCGQGQRLAEQRPAARPANGEGGSETENPQRTAVSEALVPLEVRYSAAIPPQGKGRPFWVAEGRVQLQRKTYGSSRSSEARDYWSLPRRFFIPAYDLEPAGALQECLKRLAQPEELQPGPPAAFLPVTLPVEDLQALAEFVVMAVEAQRKDRLRQVDLEVDLSPPALWVLP